MCVLWLWMGKWSNIHGLKRFMIHGVNEPMSFYLQNCGENQCWLMNDFGPAVDFLKPVSLLGAQDQLFFQLEFELLEFLHTINEHILIFLLWQLMKVIHHCSSNLLQPE